MTDEALLAEFRASRSEPAFNEIVARHGAMVYRTCLRVLRELQDAEDAAQGVFFALARRPGAVLGSLPGWLHEVARRSSLNLLRTRRRRRTHEREATSMRTPKDSPWRDEIDAALAALPAKLREAIVLRYLEGRSQEEAAREAGCPAGTIGWRASEGLQRLRALLSRRGVAVGGAALLALLAGEAQAAPAGVLATFQLSAVTAGACSAGAVAQGVVKGLAWVKLKLALAAASVVAAVALPVALLASAGTPPQAAPPAPAAAHAVTLVTDQAPDFTDLDSYLHSVTSQHASPRDKAVNLWRWSQRLRKQTAPPVEGGHEVLDPIRMFTSYGYAQCGIISGINNSLWLRLGWKGRYVQLGDHTVGECSWDGGKSWHMFDNSMSAFCFNDQGEIAGVREIEKTPRYYLENLAPGLGTNPVKGLNDQQGWRVGTEHPVEFQRSIANGVDSFLPPNELHEDHLAVRWGQTYAISLRPNESYTRHFRALDGGKPDPRTYRPLRGKDPEGSFHSFRANGVWNYAPDLKDGARVFKVDAANVVTSAKFTVRGSGVSLSTSRDAGITWSKVEGEPDVAGTTQYWVKADGGRLEALDLETITQLNRPSLPKLVRGANRVQLRLGKQRETIEFQPSIVDGNHSKTVFEEKAVEVNDKPYFNVATLRPAGRGVAQVTWRIEAPTPIVDVVFGGNVTVKGPGDRVSLLHSWDGRTFAEDWKKTDAALPYDLVVHAPVGKVPAGAKQVFLRYEFEASQDGEKWRAPGIQTALMTVHHQPRSGGSAPIEVTYAWVEHRAEGDVERTHTEIVRGPEHEYTIHVAGFRDPTMKWVRMNLGGAAKAGYSDGQDVGPGAGPRRAIYGWGTNLALGKAYTLEGRQSGKNPDAGRDLTDGVIAPPEEYVSVKYMPTNVMFEPEVSPVATLDLGAVGTVAAVRVHAGQEGGFHLTYPERIAVETSVDGKTFTRAGTAGFNQVFDPPADFVSWEQEDATKYDALPAGGRLAYAYRILLEQAVPARYVRVVCEARKGWGVLLSEIQVFDRVTVDTNVPPSVVLRPLKSR